MSTNRLTDLDLSAAGLASPTTQSYATDDINIKPTAQPMSPGGAFRRSFFDRSFSKLEKGGVRGSTFALCSAAIGGGVLSLPYMFVIVGWAMGYIIVAVSAISGVWSNLMLVKLSEKHKIKNYEDILLQSGGTCLQKSLQVMILVYVFGGCIGYQIMLCTLVGYVANAFGLSADYVASIEFRAVTNTAMAVLVLIPISLLRDISSLAFASMLSLVALTYTGILMFAELPFYNDFYRKKPNFYCEPFIIDWNFFTACSMSFFAFTCQMQLLPIYSELVRPSYVRIKKVITRSLFIDAVFYTAICTGGYWSTYNYSPQIIVARAPLPNFDPDYFMLIACGSLCLVLFAAFPCNYNPWRN